MKYRFTETPHAHWLDDKPLLGVTTVLGIISKELTWWASGMCASEFGWVNPKHNKKEDVLIAAGKGWEKVIRCQNYEEYTELLNKAYRAHNTKKEKRASEGTDTHAEVEKYIRFKMNGGEVAVTDDELFAYTPPESILPFVKWCDINVKRFLFSEIHCYSESLWVGGKTDFGYENMDGNYVLADVKSRDKDYFSDFVQCGGYDLLLRENGGFDKDGNKIWSWEKPFTCHAMFPITEKFREPVIKKNVSSNQYAFISAIQLYKLKEEFENANGN